MQTDRGQLNAVGVAVGWMLDGPPGAGAGARCLPTARFRITGILPNMAGNGHR
jgi:hypothetical protein